MIKGQSELNKTIPLVPTSIDYQQLQTSEHYRTKKVNVNSFLPFKRESVSTANLSQRKLKISKNKEKSPGGINKS